jgi:hypothetical protein
VPDVRESEGSPLELVLGKSTSFRFPRSSFDSCVDPKVSESERGHSVGFDNPVQGKWPRLISTNFSFFGFFKSSSILGAHSPSAARFDGPIVVIFQTSSIRNMAPSDAT